MGPRFDSNMAWTQTPEIHETLPIRLGSQPSKYVIPSDSKGDTLHKATMAAYQWDYQDYRVGIICVSATEKAAMEMMVDERHIGLPNKDGDENEYTLGRIGMNNVVIASLPETLVSKSAVQIAKSMQRTFSIRYHLLVGLGGGIWSKDNDIRLGDAVVSNPFGPCQGSIQWSIQKDHSVEATSEEELTRSLPSPLLHALRLVREKELIDGLDLAASLSTSIWRQVQSIGTYQYQGAATDLLFRSNCRHIVGKTCKEGCDLSMVINRPARNSRIPKIHYGIIASGTKVVKSGKSRDYVASKLNAICFDEYATGFMKAFPGLIIKGICDYADSHENWRWHSYAAGVAAAFAKEVVLCLDEKISNPCCPGTLLNFKEFSSDGHANLLQVFQTTSYESDKNRCPDRLPGSCLWFLSHRNYQKWIHKQTSTLWIAGDLGSGKSVLAKSLAENELSSNDLRTTTSFFFKSDRPPRADGGSQMLDCICAILHQIFLKKRSMLKYAIAAFEAYLDLQSFEKLWALLLDVSSDPDAGEIVCIVDGLDECSEYGRCQLIKALDALNSTKDKARQWLRLKFIITTRNSILTELCANTTGVISIIQIAGEDVSAKVSSEIACVLQMEVAKIGVDCGISSTWQDALMLKVRTVSEKTYLWLVLVVELLRKNLYDRTIPINRILEIIPKTVEEAFEANLNMINASKIDHMRRLLHILVAVERPLTIDELNIAMGIKIDSARHDNLEPSPEYLYQEELEHICRPLIRIADGKVYLLHESLREYLISQPESNTSLHKLGFRSESWKKSLSPAQSHYILAKICIQYLFLDDFGKMPPVEEDRLEELYEDYQFLEYAAKYWVLHVKFAKPNDHIKLGKQALQHLIDPQSTRFRLWYTARHSVANFCDVSRRPTALMIACYVGIVSLVKQKIEDTADMNEQDSEGYTPLMYAIRRNNVEAARLVIEHGGDVNYQFEYGSQATTPLICAMQKNGSEMVALLLTYGANVNTPNWRGQTPLLIASMMNNLESAKLLLQNGAKRDIKDGFHYPPLLWAAKNKNIEMAKLILEGGQTQDDSEDLQAVLEWAAGHGNSSIVSLIMSTAHHLQSTGPHDRPLLCIAASQGHDGVILALLVGGADVNERDSSGHTPLFWAAAAGREEVVRLLLDSGANQVAHNQGDFRTPLSKAAEIGNTTIVTMLVEAGCEIDSVDSRGRTPLCWASLMGHGSVVRLLLTHKADPNHQDERCYSPLLWALQGRHQAVAILLMESGANVDVADDNGWPPIIYALEAGDVDFGKMLINAGADVDANFSFDVKVPHRRSLLFWSVMRGYTTFVELLLNHGADTNIEDTETERTPLVKAIEQEREDVVRLLLVHGANPNFLGSSDRSPLSRACECGQDAIVLMLLGAGGNINSVDALGRTPLSWAIRSTHRNLSKILVDKGAKTDSLPYNH
ncbi:ankyrin repeat-containing domain protein [Tricladium varicosporioides]|nr:ankyrin repeat-containing domain protein [Hymenoscyphus varicosporioides]